MTINGDASTLSLLYPERRPIRVSQVLAWALDVKIDEAYAAHVRIHGPFTEDEAGYQAESALRAAVPAPDLAESIHLLEDLGLATFARARKSATSGTLGLDTLGRNT